jgi:hypothetical protein
MLSQSAIATYPETCNPDDMLGSQRTQRLHSFFSDVMLKGRYPGYIKRIWAENDVHLDIQPGDMELIAANTNDYFAFSYYRSSVYSTRALAEKAPSVNGGGLTSGAVGVVSNPYLRGTSPEPWCWPIDPIGLRYVCNYLQDRYDVPMFIVENGIGLDEWPDEEGRIREKLVKSDLVEAVVTLGDKLFYGTGLSPCFLILRRMKPAAHSARILMVDATKILTVKRAQNVLTDEDVQRIYDLYTGYADVEDYARVVTLDEVAAKDYDLSPNKYVTYHKEAVRPYAEVLAEFRAAYEEVLMREAEFRTLITL